jgi:2-polyprenyl-3-methyl-5-hydroxy-6-metoxy-1,4-benzoquinol methylase
MSFVKQLELEALVSQSVDADPRLYSFLPYLFQDLEELGVRFEDVLGMMDSATLVGMDRMLDLGCGKGKISREVAKAYGCFVEGVDGASAFVAHAKEQALAENLESQCGYRLGDIRTEVETCRNFDAVMYFAIGDILGDLGQTLDALRKVVRSNGYILIDEVFLADDAPDDVHDIANCDSREKTVALLQEAGFEVLAIRPTQGAEFSRWYQDSTACIYARAKELSLTHHEDSDMLMDFATRQVNDAELLDGFVVGATWLLQSGR